MAAEAIYLAGISWALRPDSRLTAISILIHGDKMSLNRISPPDELLLVLEENYREDMRFCKRIAYPFLAIVIIGTIFNIGYFVYKGDLQLFLISTLPPLVAFGVFAVVMFARFVPKKPTMKDVHDWHLEKVKRAASQDANNAPSQPVYSQDAAINVDDSNGNDCVQDERPLPEPFNAISISNVKNVKVLKGDAHRAVIVSSCQREVDRITTVTANGTLFINRVPLKRGNQTFYGHVGQIIDGNFSSLEINTNNAPKPLRDYVEVYVSNPDAISITHNKQ